LFFLFSVIFGPTIVGFPLQKGELQRRYRAKQKTKTNKQTNKRRKPVHPIKEMNEKLK
jgi:hypothetical protein